MSDQKQKVQAERDERMAEQKLTRQAEIDKQSEELRLIQAQCERRAAEVATLRGNLESEVAHKHQLVLQLKQARLQAADECAVSDMHCAVLTWLGAVQLLEQEQEHAQKQDAVH